MQIEKKKKEEVVSIVACTVRERERERGCFLR